jgi:hypothetical protein
MQSKKERKKKKEKSKAIPETGLGGIYGFETLGFPQCLDNWFIVGG